MNTFFKVAIAPAIAIAIFATTVDTASAEGRTRVGAFAGKTLGGPTVQPTRNGGFHCPPSSTNESGSGVCGLPLDIISNICTGRGGGMSTAPDGGVTCDVPS